MTTDSSMTTDAQVEASNQAHMNPLEAAARRRWEARRALCAAAIAAAADSAEAIAQATAAGGRPWWPALAPLTREERTIVIQTITTTVSGSPT